jgi:DNA-binding beta-propeller fold protein YncE
VSIASNRLFLFLALGVSAVAVGVGTTPGRTTPKDESADGLLLVVSKGDQTLSIVDPASGRSLATVPVGGTTGHEVAASPDGRTAWVPIYGNSGVGQPGTNGRTLSVIDLKSHTRIAEIDLGEPSRPHCALFGRKDGKLYVTAELTRSIKVIDPISRKIIDSIPTGAPESHMMAIAGDGNRAYTANVGTGTVSVVDLHARKVLT